MKYKQLIVLFFSVFTLLTSCSKKIDAEYVKSALWQWDEGFKIGEGDFVQFDTSNFYTLSHDTIYKEGIPRCIIIDADHKLYTMKVKSLDGKTGYYADTEEFTK